MRILFLAPRPPFPPEGRETVRPYHHLRFLALKHDVDLICFSGGGVDEWAARERLQRLCHRVQIVPLDAPPQHPDRVLNLLARQPLALRRYFRRDLLRRLEGVAETRRYDLVFTYSAAMAPYLSAFPETPRIADLVDVGSLRWLEYAHLSRLPARAVYRAEAARLLQTERRAAARAQRTLLASEDEARALRSLCPANPRIVSLKTPVNPRAPMRGAWGSEPTILLPGHLDHFPNRDAALRFLRVILPRIREPFPRVRVILAGKGADAEIRLLAESLGVTLLSHRPDLRALFREAWVVVAPHRVARGVRNEILEALAAGVAVVATRPAASGLDLLFGRDLLVETDPLRFAGAVARLLSDPAEIDRLGARGRLSVHNNYSHWSISLRMEEIVEEAAAERLTSS